MAGHAGDGVVQNDDGGIGLVVGRVDEARDTGVHEGGVPDDGHRPPLALAAAHLVEAVQSGDGRAHADGGVHGSQRSHRAQRVAADIPQNGEVVLFQRVEQPAVRASGAHDRGPGRDGLIQPDAGAVFMGQLCRHFVLTQLVDAGEIRLSGAGQSQIAAIVFDEAVQLLHHHQQVHGSGKLGNLPLRQGPDHAQLQDGVCIAAGLLHVLIASGGGDDAHFAVLSGLHPVDGGGLRPFGDLPQALLHNGMAALGVAGHHDVLGSIFLVGLPGRRYPLTGLHDALGVGHAGTHLHDNRGVKILRQIIGQFCKFQRLGGVAGLQHGELGGPGVVAGVLLVLGGVHSRVVGHGDNHAAVDAGVGDGEQGVGGNVEPHVLHAAEAAAARQRRAEGGFHGHLFIGGPLGVDLRILCRGLGDLGTRRAGVAGDEGAARFPEAAGNGLVAQKQFFHISGPPRWSMFLCRAVRGTVVVSTRCPGGCAPPDALRLLLPRGKSRQKRA